MLYVSSPFEAKVYRYFVPEDYSPDQQFTSFDVLLSTLVYLKYPPGNQGNSHDNCNQGALSGRSDFHFQNVRQQRVCLSFRIRVRVQVVRHPVLGYCLPCAIRTSQ